MIKINLSSAQKQVDISNVGGFDFTKLKIKAVILAIILMYVPDFVVTPIWESEFNDVTTELNLLQTQLTKLKRKVAQSTNMEKQIKELRAQEENLGKKLIAVKQAISMKRNPSGLLLFIAKNIPNEVWIKELSISDDMMILKGEALSYTSVGTFMNSLKDSIFIKDSSIKNSTSSVRDSDKRRIETFEVHFTIARFE